MKKLTQATKRRLALESLQARGFDDSYINGQSIRVSCSQCRAVAINGVACHESGCPNETTDCEECGAPIPKRQRYCEDCAESLYA